MIDGEAGECAPVVLILTPKDVQPKYLFNVHHALVAYPAIVRRSLVPASDNPERLEIYINTAVVYQILYS